MIDREISKSEKQNNGFDILMQNFCDWLFILKILQKLIESCLFLSHEEKYGKRIKNGIGIP